MPKINVYLPDDLAAAVREAKIPVSAICQLALERCLEDIATAGTSRLTADGEWPKAGLLGRFSPRARQAIAAAIAEARSVPHDYVGTEHLLLGILADPVNLGYKALVALGIEPEDLEAELRASLGAATVLTEGRPRFTETAKASLAAALKEALNFRHNYVGCEHLLLGILTTEDGMGSEVLRRMGLEPAATRRAVTTLLAGVVHARSEQLPPLDTESALEAGAALASSSTPSKLDEILQRLDAIEQRLAS